VLHFSPKNLFQQHKRCRQLLTPKEGEFSLSGCSFEYKSLISPLKRGIVFVVSHTQDSFQKARKVSAGTEFNQIATFLSGALQQSSPNAFKHSVCDYWTSVFRFLQTAHMWCSVSQVNNPKKKNPR